MSVEQARHLRKNSTDAERRLWSRLRNRQVAGLKFRRQHAVGNRNTDFFCAEAKLAIELDGAGHETHFGQTLDLDREIELYEKGIRVLRFHNRHVFDNLDGVLNAIIYAIDPERSLWPPRSVDKGDCPAPSPQSSP
jgi:adenine-specific DNA-methyltransferase